MAGYGPFLITSRVEAQFHFQQFKGLVEIRVNEVLTRGAAVLLEQIRADAPDSDESGAYADHPNRFQTRKVFPGVHLRDTFTVFVRRAFGTSFGYGQIVVWTPDPNAIWQELGTRSRRRTRYKPSTGKPNNAFPFRTSPDEQGNRGVPATYFMQRAFRKVAPDLIADLQAALARSAELAGPTNVIETVSPKVGKL